METLEERIAAIQTEYGIIGRKTEIERALASLSARKHLMIEGPVGVGKTVLALAVARHLGVRVLRVDGDERYTEQKLAGWFDPPVVLEKGYVDEAFIPGPLTQAMRDGAVLFVNELNRMPEGVQNILLPAMDEGMIEVPKVGTVAAERGFVVIATQNPREFVATTALSEAISDRFELLLLDYQSEEEETEIVRRKYPDISEELVGRAVWVTRRTRSHPNIRRGASIRAAMSISELAGKFSSDVRVGVRKAAHMAIPPRIEMREESKTSVHEVIDEIIDECFSIQTGQSNGTPPDRKEELPKLVGSRGSRGREIDVADLIPLLERSEGNDGTESDDIGWTIARQYSYLRFMLKDPHLAELARRIAIRATIRRVLQLLGPVRLPSRLERKGFTPGTDAEIDVDATLDNLVGKNHYDSSELVVEVREPKKMAVALILDASLSMTGDKLAMATAAIAVLAYRLKTVDYLLITFNDRPRTVKSVERNARLDDLIADLLSSSATGYTNIEAALRRGSEELSKATASNRVGILITDGNFTVGEDPVNAASAYKRLFVVMTESHDCRPSTCEEVARNGGGRMFSVSNFDEIPRVLYRVLRMVSHGSPA